MYNNKIKNIIFQLIIIIISFIYYSCNSCNNKTSKNKTIEKLTPKVKVEEVDTFKLPIYRYEELLFNLDPNNLNNIRKGLEKAKKDYLIFLDSDLNDPINIDQIKTFINDPVLKEAYKDIKNEYKDLSYFEKPLKQAILKYKKLMNINKTPKVYTYISGFLFEKPTIFLDSVLIIGLDTYLGKNYKMYSHLAIPSYFSKFMSKEYIVRDCMFAIGENIVQAPSKKNNRTLLDLMIYRGKILYFTDLVLPDVPDSIKIKYTTQHIEWCRKNEANVWAFFIEKKLLFSTDNNVARKFLSEGPFTAVFSKSSPPRIGEYIGWQIIRHYINNNPNISFKDLIAEKDSQKILNISGYKPKR